MPRRFQSLFWRALDQVMPDGPPIFLTWAILMLLVVNGIIAISRWQDSVAQMGFAAEPKFGALMEYARSHPPPAIG